MKSQFWLPSVCSLLLPLSPWPRAQNLCPRDRPLAPVLAYWAFTEVPQTATFIGGAIVLVAVLMSIKDDSAR
ncbi:MAG: hypothetical protein MK042_09335 [Cognatishimia sp.]|nr:hypothetical protein [Cognatishimia sp.]